MNRVFLLMSVALLLASCGVKRPLVAPKDIPAFEQRRQDRIQKMQEDDAAIAAKKAQNMNNSTPDPLAPNAGQ